MALKNTSKLAELVDQLESVLHEQLALMDGETDETAKAMLEAVNNSGGANSIVLSGAAMKVLITSSHAMMHHIGKGHDRMLTPRVHGAIITAFASIMIRTIKANERKEQN